MKNTELIKAIGQVRDEYILELLDHAQNNRVDHGTIRLRKTLRTALIAAVIAGLFVLLGAGAYALNVFGIKDLILSSSEEKIYLSEQGLQGSKEFLAFQEFIAFHDDYVAHDYYGDEMPQEQDQWMQQHNSIYFVYTQRLKDKLLELCDKYDLKLRNDRYEDTGAQWCYAALGLEDFIDDPRLLEDSAGFIAYDDGSFLLQTNWSSAPGEYLDCRVTRNMKGYFSQGSGDFGTEEVIEQWNYTTEKGTEVTIFRGEMSTYIVYDGPDAFVMAGIDRWITDDVFSDDTITAIANAIDFETLGKKSEVDLSVGKNRPVDPGLMDEQMQAHRQRVEENRRSLGEWMENYDGLEFRVDSLELSTNIYEAGWQMDQFSQDSYGCIGEICYWYPDWADEATGEMAEGLSLVTVGLTVHNTNTGDNTTHQTLNNTGSNNFPNSLLTLNYAMIRDGELFESFRGAWAWSGENPVPGQTAFVHIEPGETVSYKLAYILDEHAPDALYERVLTFMDGCISLTLAE